ncbi:MAG: ATP-binding cassette domain-containing protein [Desulfobacter sp.]|nr:ATP-binding cassette domain-containing protein [Desulfobacter sp.]
MSYLSIENLSIKLGDFELKSLDLNLDQGDYAVIIDPTGSGKSILLECIIGFFQPEKGKIILDGDDIVNDLPEKRGIGIVYQDYALLPHLSVFENIAYGLKKVEKHNIKTKVEEIAASLKIDHLLERKPDTLSGGEQQRTALARSLVVNPRLLLMDEPFSALDPGTRREIRQLLCDVIDKKCTTVIHVTHDMKDLWALADKAAILRKGQVLQCGSVRQIFERPANKFVAAFVGASFWGARVGEKINGETLLKLDDFNIMSTDEAIQGERVKVAVRPEEICLYNTPPSHLNGDSLIKTRVQQIKCEGEIWSLRVKIRNTALNINSTRNMMTGLYPKPGDTLYARINADHVRIIQ